MRLVIGSWSTVLAALLAAGAVGCGSSGGSRDGAAGDAAAEAREADDDEDDADDEMTEAQALAAVPGLKVGLAGAVRAAVAARPGTAVEAELEHDDDAPGRPLVCEVKVVGADGKVWEVSVDPGTGKVLGSEAEDEADDVAEAKAAAAALPEPGALFQAIHRAEKRSGGRAVEAEIEVEDGRAVCEVALAKDGKVTEMDVPVVRRRPGDAPKRPRPPRAPK